MEEQVLIDKYHIENFKYIYFSLRDDEWITQSHINGVMDELSAIYYKITGIDLSIEENDLADE